MLSMSKQYNTKLNNKIYYELVKMFIDCQFILLIFAHIHVLIFYLKNTDPSKNQQIRFIKSCKKNHINLKHFKEKRN